MTVDQSGPECPFAMFAVDEDVHCVWNWELHHHNLDTIRGIDPGYYEFLAREHRGHLEGPDAQRAAIGLRTAFHHGLETLFSLIGAAVQAPDTVPAWLLKSQGSLKKVVSKIDNEVSLLNKHGLDPVSWPALAQLVIGRIQIDDPERSAYVEGFASLWRSLAHEYLNDKNSLEYNAIKHGFRVSAGGFALWVGAEHERGVAPPPEEMKPLGGSAFGTSLLLPEPIVDAPSQRPDPHFSLRKHSMNWNPTGIVRALELIAVSIGNIIAFLRSWNGDGQADGQIRVPRTIAGFDLSALHNTQVLSSSFHQTVKEVRIQRFSQKEIRRRLKAASKPASTGS